MTATTYTAPPPRTARGIRPLAWTGSVIATVVLAAALVWLVAPQAGPYDAGGTLLATWFGDVTAAFVAAGIQATAAAIALATGILLLSGRARDGLVAPVVVLIAVGVTAIVLLGFDGIVIAGYTLAFFVPIGVVALVPLLARRRPVLAVLLAAAIAGVAALGALGVFPVLSFYARYVEAVAADPARFASSLVLTAFVGVWTLWALSLITRRAARAGAFVQRHRVAFTVAGAAMAVPYVVARASWLTPWPLFGGSRDAFTANPDIQVVGLMLGAAMLTGAVLTLGLVLPWGERVPRWVPRVGGRPVPVALAAVPAATVAALFTAGGVQSLSLALTGAVPVGTALMLPFWAWGPLLGLATWGYVRHRAAASV
ncbi:hypothetical protein HF576_15875 [Microbacterium sp. CFH 90308]|uniref:Uncharacterized protein n=1 Tax=Microbacterium salsuginis TaxID=2722803 RepID=A0ABX1KIX7_9MICO|nr:hypothetical protein [Microbacterium sp. CFH 90308]NLP85326.1 hypothetical protein [Microbacterium sp. CFH 90308]